MITFAPGAITGNSPALFFVSSCVPSAFHTSMASESIRITLPPVSPVTVMLFSAGVPSPAAARTTVLSAPLPLTVTVHSGRQLTSPAFRISLPLSATVSVFGHSSSLNGWQ